MSSIAFRKQPRGAAAVIAMLFLVLMSVLAASMANVATTSSRMAANQEAVERARANAEIGMRWFSWKLNTVQLPQTDIGVIDHATAQVVWPKIMTNVQSDLGSMAGAVVGAKEVSGATLHVGPVVTADGVRFELWAAPSPDYPNKAQVVQVMARGTYRNVTRTIAMNFLIQKTMRYGVLSKIPIQLGKNTAIEGDVYMAAPPRTGVPPLLSVSDFRYTSGAASPADELTRKVEAFQNFLGGSTSGAPNYGGSDNRLSVDDAQLVSRLKASDALLAQMTDYNGDSYLDEYDLFLQQFDTNGNGHQVSKSEYDHAAPNDPNLFALIDKGIGKPVNAQDLVRAGYDDGNADASDPYAKVRGTVKVWETRDELANRLGGGQTIADVMQGSFVSEDGYSVPVLFGCNDAQDPATQISPSDFNMAAFLALSGTRAGSETHPSSLPAPDSSTLYANTSVAKADGNGTADTTLINKLKAGGSNPVTTTRTVNGKKVQVLTEITESVPYGSVNPRSSVARKVFSGVNFKNCVIQRGTNALFVNCTFDGVTFVDGAYDMQQSSSSYSKGNNLRFEGCTFTGPVAQGDAVTTGDQRGAAPTAYTDYTNSWEFTGATTFDLGRGSKDGSTDSEALAQIKQQATIMAPQTNIEMGSFTAPGSATCSFQGVVVAGCFDVRGTADIDGTIIVPATAAGNITLGYFGPNDNATSQGEPDPSLVNGSYGRVHVRFNPFRTLPNGINMTVSMLPDVSSWREVIP